MATYTVGQNNFNGGELSPSLVGSYDLEKYQTCFKKGLNAVLTETREIMNRSGLEFVCEAADNNKPIRLFPFKFNSEQTCIIEAGEKYFRFIQNGGLIHYPNNYGNAIYNGKFVSDGVIGCQTVNESKNFRPNRYDDNIQKVGGFWYFDGRFEGDVIFSTPFNAPPFSVECKIMNQEATVSQVTSEGFHYQLHFAAKFVWEVDNVTAFYSAEAKSGDNFAYKYILLSDDEKAIYTPSQVSSGMVAYEDLYLQKPYGIITSISEDNNILIGYDEAKRKLQGQIVQIGTEYFSKDLNLIKFAQNADVITLVCKGYYPQELSRNGNYEWSVNKILANADMVIPSGLAGTWNGGNENPRTYKYKVTAIKNNQESPASAACGVLGEYEASWGVGEKIYLTWNAVPGASGYNIYRDVNGIYGFVGSSDAANFVDEKIEPDMSATPPIQQNPFSESENGNPGCVTYYQQRRLFANFPKYPQRFIATQVGTSDNFNISKPTVASDAMTVDLYEKEINEIKHIIALEDLIVLTTGAEWRVKGSDGTFSATPAPLCNPQTYWGCSDIPPIVSGNMILFVTSTRDSVRDLGYTYLSDSYDGDDLTTFASHLFENNKIKEWAYIKSPKPYVIAVFDDGTAGMLIYNKKQNVCGWSVLQTDGNFESVAVSREDGIDIPYFLVKREINGVCRKYIERMKPRNFLKTEECFFVDSGLSKSFENPVQEVSGLAHLEGKKVNALCDGSVVEDLTVKNGSVTLPFKAKKITIGLPYIFRLELLPLETQETVGKLKKITAVSLKIRKSREDFFVQTGKCRKHLPRSIESIKDSNFLKTGFVKTQLFGEGVTETELAIEQSLPLPLCISSITQTVTVG